MSGSLLGFCHARLFYSTSRCLSLIPYLLLSGNNIHTLIYSFILPPCNHSLSFWCSFSSICALLHRIPPRHLSFAPHNLLTGNNLAWWSLFRWTWWRFMNVCVWSVLLVWWFSNRGRQREQSIFKSTLLYTQTNAYALMCKNKIMEKEKNTFFSQTDNRLGGLELVPPPNSLNSPALLGTIWLSSWPSQDASAGGDGGPRVITKLDFAPIPPFSCHQWDSPEQTEVKPSDVNTWNTFAEDAQCYWCSISSSVFYKQLKHVACDAFL